MLSPVGWTIGTCISAVIGGLLGYWFGKKLYTNVHHEDVLKAFKEYVKSKKLVKKGKAENVNTTHNLEIALQKQVHGN